jgi:hypothetical protein
MENLIYWNNTAIGIDCGTYISWFSNASKEAIEYFSKVDTKDI